jgi:hypothetical protein
MCPIVFFSPLHFHLLSLQTLADIEQHGKYGESQGLTAEFCEAQNWEAA